MGLISTRTGLRNRLFKVTTDQIDPTYTSAVIGDWVTYNNIFPQKVKRAIALTTDNELLGMVVTAKHKVDPPTQIDYLVVAPPGEEVGIWNLGNLALFQSFGSNRTIYLSSTVAGGMQSFPPSSPGTKIRRLVVLPYPAANLTADHFNPDSPNALYVQIVDERL